MKYICQGGSGDTEYPNVAGYIVFKRAYWRLIGKFWRQAWHRLAALASFSLCIARSLTRWRRTAAIGISTPCD
jgi:hypothetical protein